MIERALAWHPYPEDEAWLIEEVAAYVDNYDRSTSARCWHKQSVWEPVIRRGLVRGEWVRYCGGQDVYHFAWLDGTRLQERWADGYVAVIKVSAAFLRLILMHKAIDAAQNRGSAKVGYIDAAAEGT